MMQPDKRMARFSLAWNPFAAATSPAACHLTPDMELFLCR